MLFNSYLFIFMFLPVTLFVFFGLAKLKYTKLATLSLVLASLVFYSYWDIRYLPLLLLSILFNYSIGSRIEKTGQKNLLIGGIIGDLVLLGYYKYANFFITTVNSTLDTYWMVPEIILPLGISFFTFTQIAYLIDAYRGETEKYSLLTYSLFVTFFPHLIAGPILYHKSIIPQFSNIRNFVFSHKNMALGIAIFTMGLFKKVIIADHLSPWVKVVFDHAGDVNFIEAWTGAIAYTLQLYFDFSGYSEMAIGLGLMLNIELPINFNSPYKSKSIIEFWRRWHITLSEFLRNYLYIPLGGNRYGEYKRMRNLLLTMLLGGLWHGAGWTFVIWGVLHGLYLVINHTWRKIGFKLPSFLAWSATFISVVLAWVFFRANTVYDAANLIRVMFGSKGIVLPEKYSSVIPQVKQWGIQFLTSNYLSVGNTELITLFVLLIGVVFLPNPQQILPKFRPNIKWTVALLIIAIASLINLQRVSEFLYFQF